MTTNTLEILSAGVSFPEVGTGRVREFNIRVKDFHGLHSDDCEVVIDHGDKASILYDGEVEENKEFFGIRGEFRFAFKRGRNWMWPTKGEFNSTYYLSKKEYEEATGTLVTEVRIFGKPCFVKREYAAELLAKFVPYARLDENGDVTYSWASRFLYEDEQRKREAQLEQRKITAVEFRKELFETQVWATLEDGSVEHVFNYFDDEIHFSEYELVGRSLKAASELRHRKDVAYLRS